MLALVAGVGFGTLAVLYAIQGKRRPRRPYPAGPGAPIDDGLPGGANIVPWGGEDPIVDEAESAEMARRMAREEGLFVGLSSGGACTAALKVAAEAPPGSVIVFIVCDRGDKYLSMESLFPA